MGGRGASPLLIACLALGVAARAGEPASKPRPAAAKALLQDLLASRDPTEQVQALLRQLGDAAWAVRERATRELIALGPAATPLVEAATRSDDPEVRWRARQVLEAQRREPVDLSAQVGEAIDALAEARDPTLLPALVQLLAHAREDVRYAAEYGLRRLTGQCFGYNATAGAEARAAAAARWQAWWKEAGPQFAFAARPEAPPEVGGVLICSRRFPRASIVDLQGEVLWSRAAGAGRWGVALLLPNGNLLVADMGRHVVEERDPEDRVVWAVQGEALKGAVLDLQRLPNGNTVLAHTSGHRILEADPEGDVVWQRRTHPAGPYSVQRLPSGHTLAALYGRPGRVVELTRAGKVAWSVDSLQGAWWARRLPNGHTLIAESRGKRVLEVDRKGEVVWQRMCEGRPTSACRLPDGSTVISESEKGVLLVRPDGTEVRQLDAEARWATLRLVPAAALPPRVEPGK